MSDDDKREDWISVGKQLKDGEKVRIHDGYGWGAPKETITREGDEIRLYDGYGYGNPKKTARISGSNDCFIATVVYRDPEAYEVQVLRGLRDSVLQNSNIGRAFIKFYYSGAGKKAAFHIKRVGISVPIFKTILNAIVKYHSKRAK